MPKTLYWSFSSNYLLIDIFKYNFFDKFLNSQTIVKTVFFYLKSVVFCYQYR